jgi:hypothetical protein
MESFRILALLCLVSGFSIGNTNAQMSSKLNNNLSIGSTTKSICNRDTSFSQKNSLCLFRATGLTLPRQNIKEIPNSVFLSQSENYNELLKTSNDNGISLTGEPPSMTNSGTFNGKWERLTGKSITSRVYYTPLKRTNNPAISDNQFYRTGANIFNMLVSVKYPYLNRSK